MEGVPDIVIFLGRFHPLLVHLPIGFLTLAILFEILSRRPATEKLDVAVRFIWLCSALSAVVAAILGYLLSLGGGYDEEMLAQHQWFGISLVVMAGGCYLLKTERLQSKLLVRRAYRVLLVLITLSLIITGHLGGSLTHGSEYLVEFAPKPIQRMMGSSPMVEDRPKVTSLDSADIFKDAISPILNSKCTGCHNSNKRKGELILTSFSEIMKGGENGAVITPGSLASSEMYRRISLPKDHKDFMPSEGKRPLSDEQLAIIEWWIEKDAPENGFITSLGPDENMTELFEKYYGLGKNKEDEIIAPEPDTVVINRLIRYGFSIRRLAAGSNLLEAKYSGSLADTTKIRSLLGIKDQLVWLQLSNTGISDDALQLVGKLSNLRKLNVSRNTISDKGVNHLLGLSNLKYLNLYETNVTDSVLVSVLTLPRLEELYLWQTRVTHEYVEKLKPGKPGVKIIYQAP
jgi:uncharacterized membrane protein